MISDVLPPEFAEPLACGVDRLGAFAGRVLWYAEVSSTSDVAAVLAERGAEEGTVVMANAQSSGRGRHGRPWISPPGAGLYLSIVLRPSQDAVFLLTIAAGLAVAEGIQAASGLATRVKWPNDINAGGRKLAGILAEAGSSTEGIQHVVLGIGINVGASSYPAHIADLATSLETELGRTVDRGLLLVECLAALARRYGDLHYGRSTGVLQEWRRRAASTFGRTVECETGGPCVHGVAENIDDTGALLVRTTDGIHRVMSGVVRWM